MSSSDSCAWDFGDVGKVPCEAGATATDAEAVKSFAVQATYTSATEGAYTVCVVAANTARTVQVETKVATEGAGEVALYLPVLSR